MPVRVFFTAGALARELARPPMELETSRGLFGEPVAGTGGGDGKLVLLVVDHDVDLDGEHLAVVGGRHLAGWRRALPAAPPDGERLRSLHSKAVHDFPLRWVYFTLERLTPLRLLVRPRDGAPPADDPLVGALYGQLLALTLIYTANQSRYVVATGAWRFTYGSGQIAELAYSESAEFATVLAGGEPGWNPCAAATTLAEKALWAYDDGGTGTDRLHVLQSVVAERLQSNDARTNGRLIAEHAELIAEQTEWSWQTFIEGKLKIYFDRVHQVEELVATTVEGFGDQVRALTKSLSDRILAGVAVVVGSFLGALFTSNFNASVFRLGVLLYAAYLLLFPGLIGLVTAWQQFRSAGITFERRMEEFRKRLYARTVDQLVGTSVAQAGERFENWFVATAMIYGAVVCALILAAVAVPFLVR